jgi:glutamate racemase
MLYDPQSHPTCPPRSRRWIRPGIAARGGPAAVAACCLALVGGAAPAEPVASDVEAIVSHATSSPAGDAAFTFVPADLRGDTRSLPIGVFDSGIGGLTVLEAILAADAFDNRSLKPGPDGRPDFEHERFVYLGDQANMPYGNYPREGNEAYLRELILKDVIFLLGRRRWPDATAARAVLDKPPVKALVIACNTATAYGLEDVRAALAYWDVPVFVVGVVEAGARGVLEAERSAGPEEATAVLATVGTCDSMAYPRAIATAFGRAGRRSPTVVQRGFSDLAAAIEGDPDATARTSIEQAIATDLRALVEEHHRSHAALPIGRLVLGCTHFPLVREQILAELERLRGTEREGERPFQQLIAPRITVIDPAGLAARELFRTLALERMRAPARENGGRDVPDGSSIGRSDLFFLSVPAEQFPDGPGRVMTKFHRPPGRLDVEDTRVVPLEPDLLPATVQDMIRTRLPHVWRSLGW